MAKDKIDYSAVLSLSHRLIEGADCSRKRALFGYAITSLGEVYLPCKFSKKLYRLVGNRYARHIILDTIKALADLQGIKYQVFYSPLNPDVVSDLVFADRVISTNPKIARAAGRERD